MVFSVLLFRLDAVLATLKLYTVSLQNLRQRNTKTVHEISHWNMNELTK